MTILVTRPEPAAEKLVNRLREAGKDAWSMPLIEFTPGGELDRLPNQLSELQPNDLVFIVSQHVIHYAKAVLAQAGMRWPAGLNYYAIGRTTGLAFHAASGRNVTWPEKSETSEVLIQLPSLQQVAGKQALILRGNGGRQLLAETLQQRGANVKFVECYKRCEKYYQGETEGRRWRSLGITTLVVTSGEMLEQLYSLFPDNDREEWLLHCQVIVVSERLATRARELGWNAVRVAEGADNNALLRALQ
ncbi:uroporphyrinogen-III synthase [Erwinia tracheiphila]|uniref:Uroporphyrinogen-III synthase n=1 Tax=Erwinia tracheiphila TaxID=65700 RepID=A0A0M2KH18_9GAMM|nr:uroporphyrinogen-III synthase [Erwinia tracheiphila]AXF77861.1 uroporphyrinogen-III synthase [Erwinia tracheiphila]EOS93590.1 uroporphyrinogen III synthase [Erwinia tracheiphila PSU-1]KKF36528.1 uroporphyrinogen-III synthase [Erwinia tracheiphila]UIA83434.1 uroporphyrinogen-III synthase [Erwinia tracheiphila]UIA87861.1 uroporphyrinogen-III synthase [Erwinia tracheiphila]